MPSRPKKMTSPSSLLFDTDDILFRNSDEIMEVAEVVEAESVETDTDGDHSEPLYYAGYSVAINMPHTHEDVRPVTDAEQSTSENADSEEERRLFPSFESAYGSYTSFMRSVDLIIRNSHITMSDLMAHYNHLVSIGDDPIVAIRELARRIANRDSSNQPREERGRRPETSPVSSDPLRRRSYSSELRVSADSISAMKKKPMKKPDGISIPRWEEKELQQAIDQWHSHVDYKDKWIFHRHEKEGFTRRAVPKFSMEEFQARVAMQSQPHPMSTDTSTFIDWVLGGTQFILRIEHFKLDNIDWLRCYFVYKPNGKVLMYQDRYWDGEQFRKANYRWADQYE